MTHHAQNAPTALTISNIHIRQDAEGRYCLNDLHRAAGGQAKHKPSEWLRNKQTIDLAKEFEKAGIPAIQSKQQLGTFVHKDMVYDYAMWISAAFKVKVIRAYDALMTQAHAAPAPEPEISATLQAALCHEAQQLAAEGYASILAELTERARHYLRTGIPETDILDCLKRKAFGRASPVQPKDLKPLLAQARALFNHLNDLVEGGSELCAKRLR